MVNAAVNHEPRNGDDVGNRRNLDLVSFGQRISKSHLGAGDDANGGGCISEHLVGKRRQTHQNCENEQRHPNRQDGEKGSAFATQQVLEQQAGEFSHVFSSPTRLVATGPWVWRTSHPSPDRKSTRLNSSHVKISYAVFC